MKKNSLFAVVKATLFLFACSIFIVSYAQNRPASSVKKGSKFIKKESLNTAELDAINALNALNNKKLMDDALSGVQRPKTNEVTAPTPGVPSGTAITTAEFPSSDRSTATTVSTPAQAGGSTQSDHTKDSDPTSPLTDAKSSSETPAPLNSSSIAPVAEIQPVADLVPKSIEPSAQVESEQRLALIIGNSNYKSSPLINPTNDARAMAIALQKLGFTVIKKENAGREDMMTSVREFGNRLKDKGGIGLFYYAGHGIQSKGVNYLIPTDANIAGEDELSTRAYDSAEVLEKMDTAKNRINMVILDACRDNPFAKSFRSGSRGLASVATAPSGTLIAYATSPGSVASDGSGANGLYTEQLLNAIAEPGLKLEDVFKKVRVNVMERSEKKQTPWETSSVTGDFYFNPGETQIASVRPALVPAKATAPRVLQILIPKKLVENYQLAGGFQLDSIPVVSAFSTSSREVRFGSPNKMLSAWNTLDGRAINSDTDLSHISLTSDKKQIVALTEKNEVAVFDLQDVSSKIIMSGAPKDIVSYVISPNSKSLLVYSKSSGYYLFNLKKPSLITRLNEMVEGDAQAVFSPAGDRFVTWSPASASMYLWDSITGQKIGRLSDHWKTVGLVKFSDDGAHILSAAKDERMIVWRAADGKVIKKLDSNAKDPLPTHVEFLAKSTRALMYYAADEATATKSQLLVWDWQSGAPVASVLPDRLKVLSYFVTSDDTKLLVNAADNSIHVYDLTSLKRLNTLVGMRLLSISSDGKFVYARNSDGIRIFDVQNLSPVARLPDQVAVFESGLGFSTIATTSADGILSLWNRKNGESYGTLEGHADVISTVLFSNDARRIISISNDNKGLIWALPDIQDIDKLVKDPFETTADFMKRMNDWNSPYTSLVELLAYNADTEVYTLQIGDVSFDIPYERSKAKLLSGQRQAKLSGKLKFLDDEQLIVESPELLRLK